MSDEFQKCVEAGNKALAVFDHKGAVSKFKKAVSMAPDQAEAHFGYAEAALGVEKIPEEEIVSSYMKALELDSKNAFYHARLGAFLLDSGRFDEAREQYEKASSIDPEGTPYYWTEMATGLYLNWNTRHGEEANPQEEREMLARVLEYLIRSVGLDRESALELLK